MNCCTETFFGEGDAVRRRAAIEELYTDDCVLYVQPGVFVGHDAMDKFAGNLRATHPHFSYTPHGARRRCITPAGRDRVLRSRIILVWMSLAMTRSLLYFSIQCRHDLAECSQLDEITNHSCYHP
jgi:hypothetical protein